MQKWVYNLCNVTIFKGKVEKIMAYVRKHPVNNRLLIIQEAARMFVEEGYTKSSISRIAQNLNLSLGNITFYFKTKEHLLAVLLDDMFHYQERMMEEYAEEGKSSLLAYCLELTALQASQAVP